MLLRVRRSWLHLDAETIIVLCRLCPARKIGLRVDALIILSNSL